ncbi:MAG TPA: RluA family pseudouridine synthase [Opitutaceae bacterium]|nr:RluA family pseudouridine synthase [Opitutaceae bacterium]
MSTPLRLAIAEGVRRARADKALASAFPGHSRVAFQRAFDAGLVTLRGQPIKRSATVRAGDVLEFSLPEVKPAALRAVDLRLDVFFEDKWLLAVDKPAGMVVHPGAGTREDTLVHALLAHCAGSLSGIGGVARPGIVHRLDRETSGAIIVAKTDEVHRDLARQFAARAVVKEYLALVSGVPRLMSGTIRKSIGRNLRQRHKMAVVGDGQRGRAAWTDWAIVERYGDLAALVACTLHTGRTHQIRVHMASLGHPVLGDSAYGWKANLKMKLQPGRVMLHAGRLSLVHPGTGGTLDLRAPLPADFKAQIAALKDG